MITIMPATKAAQDQWFVNAPGRAMDPDRAFSLQCKDVIDDYATVLFGNWQNTVRPGNGKDVFNNANPTFFTKVLNNLHDQNLIPPRGSIVVFGASRAVPEGHVAVVESSDIHGMTVIQQDGYLQYPARRVRLPYVLPNGAALIGWLIPKLEAPKHLASPNEIQSAYMQYLERAADQGGIDHYTRYTIDFVRADLQGSQEFRSLQERKAQVALANANAEKRRAAEAAEAQRIAEEQAAAERLRRQAEEQARAVQLAKQNAVIVANIPLPPAPMPLPEMSKPIKKPTSNEPSVVVRFLFAFIKALVSRNNTKA